MAAEALPADDAGVADAAAAQTAAYVHIPFCRRVCPYCDFAVTAGRTQWIDRYVRALVAEIERTPRVGSPIAAVAVGGGTPTRLSASQLDRIVEAIRAAHGVASDAEISIEANPEDWTPTLAGGLADAGFTRVSLGAQSFDVEVLGALGRAHRPEDVCEAVAVARTAGFRSINLDLIYGTPGESGRSWRMSVRRALESGVDHLSCYALTVERGTPLSRAVAAGAAAPDPDDQADKYEEAWEIAAAAGLRRYETSNAARSGHACRYNLITWACGSYHGFGNGAHRHLDGERSWNVRRLDRYLEAVESGRAPHSGAERVGGWAREQERLVLGLRRRAGVVAGVGGARLLASEWGVRLVEEGIVVADGDRICVARPLLGDEAARAVLALESPDC
jgi:oxygen-independent coproporphyrinogen-3 oxidase